MAVMPATVLMAAVQMAPAFPDGEDQYGPVRVDERGRIRGDVKPFTCSGKFDEAGWIYGPDNYGCKPGSSKGKRVTIKKGDTIKYYNDPPKVFDGDFDDCAALVSSRVVGDTTIPETLGCFNCYVTINKDGTCFFYNNCGVLGYTKGDFTIQYCGLS